MNSLYEKYLNLISYLYYEEVHNMTELNNLIPAKVRKNLKLAIDDIGLEKVIEVEGIDKVIKTIGIEKVLDTLDPEVLEKYLQKKKIIENK
jgi:hypothetical protein